MDHQVCCLISDDATVDLFSCNYVYLEIIMLNIEFKKIPSYISEYRLVCTQFALTTPFWAVNLRIDGARATDEAAAAAATRILQNLKKVTINTSITVIILSG